MIQDPSTAQSDSSQPFWKEDQEILSTTIKPLKTVDMAVKTIGVFMVLAVFGITFGLAYQAYHFWALGIVVYFIVVIGTALTYQRAYKKKQELLKLEIARIQARAGEKAGASLMGSAIHVAGNPRLAREQKIVLALTDSSLDLYTFEHDRPLDSIPLSQIAAIHTVVYDQDQTPHLGAVDSTAEALQITVKYGDVSYDILFRNMRKVHPIDWYQAIQNARLQVEKTRSSGIS